MYTRDEVYESTLAYFDGDNLATQVFFKYVLKDKQGNFLEKNPDDMHRRLAKEFARIEAKYPNPMSEDYIYSFLKDFRRIVPQGSPMSGIGNNYQNVSLSNCFVVASPPDHISGIVDTGKNLANIMKRRGGVGLDISTLRPDGSPVSNAAGTTSGAWSFADFYSYICRMIGQCIAEGEKVLTKRGLINIENVIPNNDMVFTKEGWINVLDNLNNGTKDVLEITTKAGYKIKTTKDHKFLTEQEGQLVEKCVQNFSPNDIVVLLAGDNKRTNNYVKLKTENYPIHSYNKSNRLNNKVTLPDHFTEDLSYIIGYSYGDGCVEYQNNGEPFCLSLSCANTWPTIKEKLKEKIQSVFDYIPSIKQGDGDLTVIQIFSRKVVEHLKTNKILKEKSEHIKIPDILYFSPISVICSFIAGYLDADGTNNGPKSGYVFASIQQQFLQEIQKLLLSIGIPSKLHKEDRTHLGWRNLYTLSITGKTGQSKFVNLFYESEKVKRNPYISKRDNWLTPYKSKTFDLPYNKYSYIPDNTQYWSSNTFEKYTTEERKDLGELLLQDTIVSIVPIGKTTTYDLVLPEEHLFWCNGFYTHNSGRRGALMISMDVRHPDILKFIRMKHDLTKVTGANISVKLTDEFMQAVENNEDYIQHWPMEYPENADLPTAKRVSAREVWNAIIESATKTAEPGILMWDNIIKTLPAHRYPGFTTISCNPCSELSLSEFDACRLISINLKHFAKNPFKNEEFDWEQYKETVAVAQRLSDDLIDLEIEKIDNILSLVDTEDERELWEKIRWSAENGRRTGLGTHGLADLLARLCCRYDSGEAIEHVDAIYEELKEVSYFTSVVLAKERGHFPAYDAKLEENHPFLDTLSIGVKEEMMKYGRRNISLLTNAPTGSVSILSQCSSGIEPCFQLSYTRRRKRNHNEQPQSTDFIDDMGDRWEEFEVFHHNYKEWIDNHSTLDDATPDYFVTSAEIDWKQRVNVQAAIQKSIDHSISSCLAANNHLIHTDKGLRYLEDIIQHTKPQGFVKTTNNLETINHLDEKVDISAGYINGEQECLKVLTEYNEEIIGTKNHKLLVLHESHKYNPVWKELQHIQPGDYIIGRKGLECFGDSQKTIQSLFGPFEIKETRQGFNTKQITIPHRMSTNFARLLGYFISDCGLNNNGITLTQLKNDIVEDFQEKMSNVFSIEYCSISQDLRSSKTLLNIAANSRILREYLESYIGITRESHTKSIPKVIFYCAGRRQTKEFLKGLTLDGHVSEDHIVPMTTSSKKLSKEIQVLLNQFGIQAGIYTSKGYEKIFPNSKKEYIGKDAYVVTCTGINAERFVDLIGFAEERKQQESLQKFRRPSRKKIAGYVPNFGLRESIRQDVMPHIKSDKLYNFLHSFSSKWKNKKAITRDNLLLLEDLGMQLPSPLLTDDTYRFCKVKSVKQYGVHDTYDLSIPQGHSYLVNGVISHNTINLPKGTPSSVVGELYKLAWKKGLKGITVYVDGSRSGVLVNKEEKKFDYQDSIKRPECLEADIHTVSVKGEKWTIVVGLTDNKPYEVFGGLQEDIELPAKYKKGIICKRTLKSGKNKYDLVLNDGWKLKDIVRLFDNQLYQVHTRMISLCLRHGTRPSFLVEQLLKDPDNDLTSFSKVVARVLKTYIENGTEVTSDKTCPECKAEDLVYQDGCKTCKSCGWSGCE